MKHKALKLSTAALFPAIILLAAGCWGNPYVIEPTTGSPAFVGGMVRVDSASLKAVVQSVDVPQRAVVLKLISLGSLKPKH